MFSIRLKLLRKQHELTQHEFAQKINVSGSAVAMWERGQREPDIDMLIKLANYFNIDINYLLGISNDRTPPVKKKITVTLFLQKKAYIQKMSNRLLNFTAPSMKKGRKK